MPIYKAPLEDVSFLLNDVFQIDRYDNLPGFSDASADVREAVLTEAAKLSEEVLQPLNRVGDLEGCVRHDDGRVTTPKGFKQAFDQVAEGGWLGLSAPTEYGGQGLPVTLTQIVTEFQCSANMAFSMYGGLTQGATAALLVHGAPEQKKMFVAKMVAGQWTGTMNLIEPQDTPLRAPSDPSALTRTFGTTNSETPLIPLGAPSIRASTRWMMLSARSCSPAEMKILVPVIL